MVSNAVRWTPEQYEDHQRRHATQPARQLVEAKRFAAAEGFLMAAVSLTLLSQPYSKSNSRKIVTIGRRTRLIKSEKALAYERDALRQIPPSARQRIDVPVKVTMRIYYANERPDLDESLILDVLQDRYTGSGAARTLVQAGVYRNDRLVRERHIYHGIDKKNPRAEIVVEPLVRS